MNTLIETHLSEIPAICRRFGVARLEVFGSATTSDFDPKHSDLDFLIEFDDNPNDLFKRYFGLKELLEARFGRSVDLVMVNAMRNPVSAATGRGGNANDRDPVTRNLAIRLAGEAIKVGLAHGYQLEKVYKMDPMQVMAASDGDGKAMEACEKVLLDNVKFRNDDQRPSMGQDIMKGRRTEIDYINGLVCTKAAELGLSTPANAGIVAAVKRVERGEIPLRRRDPKKSRAIPHATLALAGPISTQPYENLLLPCLRREREGRRRYLGGNRAAHQFCQPERPRLPRGRHASLQRSKSSRTLVARLTRILDDFR